jgi:hypothetical protein
VLKVLMVPKVQLVKTEPMEPTAKTARTEPMDLTVPKAQLVPKVQQARMVSMALKASKV